MALAALWVAVGFGAAAWHPDRDDDLQCTFLAVGHGTCVVLEFPGGQTLLYDAGSLGSPESAANIVSGVSLVARHFAHRRDCRLPCRRGSLQRFAGVAWSVLTWESCMCLR